MWRVTLRILFKAIFGVFLLKQMSLLGSFEFVESVIVDEPVLFSSVYQLNKQRAYKFEQGEQVTINHKAVSGLGHRLGRLSNAFHLSKALNLSRLSVDWSSCASEPIFDHLFGKGPLVVLSPTQPLFPFLHSTDGRLIHRDARSKVEFVNNVPYYSRAFKRRDIVSLTNMTPPFYGKVESDIEMYRQLLALFRFRGRVQTFIQANNFSDHTLLGLHVRAGNGETGDFTKKNRGFSDLDRWLTNITDLVSGYSQSEVFPRPPMIFLSTDTFEVISKVKDAFSKYGIPVTFAPQDWVPSGKGVSYAYNSRLNISSCLQGWVSQFMDMMLLSESDIVIAAKYSSFTQTLPLSIMFHKAASSPTESSLVVHPRFCEIAADGDVMSCYDNFRDWIMKIKESRFPVIENNQRRKRVIHQNSQYMLPIPDSMSLEALQKLFNGTGLVLN